MYGIFKVCVSQCHLLTYNNTKKNLKIQTKTCFMQFYVFIQENTTASNLITITIIISNDSAFNSRHI